MHSGVKEILQLYSVDLAKVADCLAQNDIERPLK